jgi:alpha-1,3-rhamnosyltransferase
MEEKNITKNDALEQPLVSIIVITYNSSKYVLETLESAKAQTYQNIELIVSDDCSTDNTAEICREWIENNKERFVRTELITAEKNTGIPANCNRGVKAAQGEWVKFIAGDDILLSDCIEEFIKFIEDNSDCYLLFSNSIVFGKSKKKYPMIIGEDKSFNLPTAKKQFEKLLLENWVNAVGSFINRKIIIKIGLFDESIKYMEDYPFWLKATSKGYKLYHIGKTTTKYRLTESSLTCGSTNTDKLTEDRLQILYKYQIPYMSLKNILYIWNNYLDLKFHKRKNNKIMLFSPLFIFSKIKKICGY